jgi:elongation factor 2
MDLEASYQTFSRAIESVNVIIATYKDELLGDVQVYPQLGTVGFGSGLQSWGFTIERFAVMYMKKFGIKKDQMMKKLWGDSFFNPATKKWTDNQYTEDGKTLERGFVTLIMTPISTLFDAVMNDKKEVYTTMVDKLGFPFPKDAKDLLGKPLLKRLMQEWLPAAEALLEMIVNHLPSPKVAQKYRVENLYSGPLDDDCAKAIRTCDQKGPLVSSVPTTTTTTTTNSSYRCYD